MRSRCLCSPQKQKAKMSRGKRIQISPQKNDDRESSIKAKVTNQVGGRIACNHDKKREEHTPWAKRRRRRPDRCTANWKNALGRVCDEMQTPIVLPLNREHRSRSGSGTGTRWGPIARLVRISESGTALGVEYSAARWSSPPSGTSRLWPSLDGDRARDTWIFAGVDGYDSLTVEIKLKAMTWHWVVSNVVACRNWRRKWEGTAADGGRGIASSEENKSNGIYSTELHRQVSEFIVSYQLL